MPDTSLSEAIAEAYASAPTDEIIYYTLEFRHAAFSQPIRVVRGHDNLTATLEDNAPLNPGEAVEFVAYAFDLTPPEINDGGQPELQIVIDNISREIVSNIEAAVVTPTTIEVTLRLYLLNDVTVPQNDPPMHLVVRHIEATPFHITARAGFEDLSRAAFPREVYKLNTFPGLAR